MTRTELKRRRPDQWVDEIKKIRMPLRCHVARIVWWDYLSERTPSADWRVLDDYLDRCLDRKWSETATEYALVEVGYSNKDAKRRSIPARTHTVYERRKRERMAI